MEDFVTFEIAKKLKEKGFDIPCIYAYCKKGGWNKYTQKHEPITYILRTDGNPFGAYYTGDKWNKKYETNKNKIQCSAPTISQVVSWLEDKKKIFLTVDIESMGFFFIINYDILMNNNGECEFNIYNSMNVYPSSIEAALAGIEYVLDNML